MLPNWRFMAIGKLIESILTKLYTCVMENKHDSITDETLQEELKANEAAQGDQSAAEQKNELTELTEQVNELKDKYLRQVAEFENYKKRTVKEKLDLLKTAAQDTIAALLPVLDDFERAKKSAEEGLAGEVFSDGVRLVYNKLNSILEQKGLKVMESTGQPFNPEMHEAVTEIPAGDELKGKVVDTIEKGYYLQDKLIRYAKVVVGK